MPHGTNGETRLPRFAYARSLLLLLLAATVTLSACGGSASGGSESNATLSGNWQFTMAPQTDGNKNDPTFNGGLQGGFLLQNNDSVTGQTVYSVTSSTFSTPCSSGSAAITGTISGENVTLTEVAGTQTYTLTGTLSSDGSTIMGTPSGSTSTAGTAADGSACGYAETALQWSAILVPPLTGTIQGSFHSTGGGTGLSNQDFAVAGTFTQGQNIGASNATITGSLSFINPASSQSDYPCFSVASVNGQISGNSVILQIIGTNGSDLGQIGAAAGSPTNVNPVTFYSVQGGYILHGVGPSYLVASKSCPGNLGSASAAGDSGDICLALNSTTACQQPITLSPAVVTFPAQMLGSATATQTITLTNISGSTLNNLNLSWAVNGGLFNGAPSDFDGLSNLTEADNCSPSGKYGTSFSLGAGNFCTITVSFTPQESCPWLPFPTPPSVDGAAPEWCPFPLSASLVVSSPSSADIDTQFLVPISGIGLSAIQPSTPELDFSAEAVSEASLPQVLSFTNNSANSVQVLGSQPCVNPPKGSLKLPHPLSVTSPVAGLLVVGSPPGVANAIAADVDTITYNCDSDPGTFLPNFQISGDTCTGTMLASQATCSLQVAYVPQPNTHLGNGLDYFLELNTVQCSGTVTSDCEIDSGRFPVELKTEPPSPLRMSPGAALDFGNQKRGTTSAPLTITLVNDPALTYPQCPPAQDCATVTFVGKILVSGNYVESDDCAATLAQGSSCTLSVTFTPGSVGFTTGTLTINYTQVSSSGTATAGNPQIVYLRGKGQ